ncbi:MAG: folate-binding protein [Pseudomonadota bacterium]
MIETLAKNSIVNLVDLGLIQVTGKNSAQFLQGQLTCDVTEVNAEQSRLGAHCDAKGRVQATFRLFFYQDAYYFLLLKEVLPHLLLCLKKYAVFSAVNLIDVTQHWKIIGLGAPSNTHLLSKKISLPKQDNSATLSETIISLAVLDSRFILLSADKESLSFIEGSFNELPINNWHLWDIEAGIPMIYPETIGQFTPHQLNYPAIGGVSLNKGCYIGQEIIARTHYLGKSKSRLHRLAFQANNDFPPGTLIKNDEGSTQGTVIMAASEKNNHYQALACLQTQAISHTIHLESPQGPILTLLKLPTE